MSNFDSDPLAFWRSLREYPSLIGAHLVDMSELRRYEEALVAGLENVRRDIEEVDIEDPERAETELRRAVEKVVEAVRLIDEAQRMIVRRFST